MRWAKVDKTGTVIEVVDANEQPAAEGGFTYRAATSGDEAQAKQAAQRAEGRDQPQSGSQRREGQG